MFGEQQVYEFRDYEIIIIIIIIDAAATTTTTITTTTTTNNNNNNNDNSLQKTAILGTSRIIRKVLQAET
jgi:hypothetical protein